MGFSGNLKGRNKKVTCTYVVEYKGDGSGEEDDRELHSGLELGNLRLPVALAFQKQLVTSESDRPQACNTLAT